MPGSFLRSEISVYQMSVMFRAAALEHFVGELVEQNNELAMWLKECVECFRVAGVDGELPHCALMGLAALKKAGVE